MGLLNRAQLLTKEELKKEKVVLDEAQDEYVFVRQMTAHEKSIWEMSQVKQSGKGKGVSYDVTLDDYRAKLAVVCICDEEGELLFKPNDYLELSMNISASKLEKIVDVAQRLNAITEEDREEIVKN
jgi:hypothetical protein